MSRQFLPLLALVAACGDDLRSYDLYEDDPDGSKTVTLWIAPHPDIPAELARMACESWRPEGVLSALVDDPHSALIRVRPSEGECVENEDGSYPLGRAWVGGEIALEIECLRRFGGTPPARSALWPVIAHEVGHQLGIWTHVPVDCDGPEVMTHPEGGPVCGVALMNPMVHRGLDGITVIDHYAYDLRNEDLSVLRLTADEGCTFVGRD